jgi:3-oxoacyl-[acyl-carrier protein] reductase
VNRGLWAPELKGKTAIVTGAGRLRSMGRPIANELARQGVNVVVVGTGRDPSTYPVDEQAVGWRDIDSVADEIASHGAAALPLVCDISDTGQVDQLISKTIERFGSVDILINNAGAARAGDRAQLVDLPLSEWHRVLNVNLTGTFNASQRAARRMIAQGTGGCIVNISSIAARRAPPGVGAYAASKAAVNAMSRTLALELARNRIRVNALLPGTVETSRLDDLGRGDRWQAALEAVPLGFAGNGSEIAYMCTYLCSDMGAWITGQDIAVDGGASWH